jgi:hypothetical protein
MGIGDFEVSLTLAPSLTKLSEELNNIFINYINQIIKAIIILL